MIVRVLDGQPFGGSGAEQYGIGADKYGHGLSSGQIVIAKGKRAGKLDRIVGAQRTYAAQCSGTRNDSTVHLYHGILAQKTSLEIAYDAIAACYRGARDALARPSGERGAYLNERDFRHNNIVASTRSA